MNNKSVLIGNRIKECRKEKKLSQDYIAECCGVDARQTIGKWENGASTPTVEQLYILCDLFDCDIGYLLSEYEGRTRIIDDVQKHISLSQKAIKKLLKWSSSSSDCIMPFLDALLCEQGFLNICGMVCTISWKYFAVKTVEKKSKTYKMINKIPKKITSPYDFVCNKIKEDIGVDEFHLSGMIRDTLGELIEPLQKDEAAIRFSGPYIKHQCAKIKEQYPALKFEED